MINSSGQIEQRRMLRLLLNGIIEVQQIVEGMDHVTELNIRRVLQEKLSVTRQQAYDLATNEELNRQIILSQKSDALSHLECLAEYSSEVYHGPTVPSDEQLGMLALISENFTERARTYLRAKVNADNPLMEVNANGD